MGEASSKTDAETGGATPKVASKGGAATKRSSSRDDGGAARGAVTGRDEVVARDEAAGRDAEVSAAAFELARTLEQDFADPDDAIADAIAPPRFDEPQWSLSTRARELLAHGHLLVAERALGVGLGAAIALVAAGSLLWIALSDGRSPARPPEVASEAPRVLSLAVEEASSDEVGSEDEAPSREGLQTAKQQPRGTRSSYARAPGTKVGRGFPCGRGRR